MIGVVAYGTGTAASLSPVKVAGKTGTAELTTTVKKEGDPDNWIGFGQRTIDEMSHAWLTYFFLSEEEFQQAVAERNAQAKEKLSASAGQ